MTVALNKDGRLAQLDDAVDKLKREREVLGVQYKKLGDSLSANFKKMQELGQEAMDLRFERMLETGVFDWQILLAYDIGEANYKAKNKALLIVFEDRHVTSAGYFPETLQYSLELRLDHASANKLDYICKVLEEQILPVVKPIKDEKSKAIVKVIKLMEPSLSENGNHQIWLYGDKVALCVTRGWRTETVHTTGNLREMLEYAQKRCAFGCDD